MRASCYSWLESETRSVHSWRSRERMRESNSDERRLVPLNNGAWLISLFSHPNIELAQFTLAGFRPVGESTIKCQLKRLRSTPTYCAREQLCVCAFWLMTGSATLHRSIEMNIFLRIINVNSRKVEALASFGEWERLNVVMSDFLLMRMAFRLFGGNRWPFMQIRNLFLSAGLSRLDAFSSFNQTQQH